MRDFLYKLMGLIARCHDAVLRLNDTYEVYLSDKMLHFLIIGLIGMLGIALVYPVFKSLSRKGHIMTITWIYVFTMVLVLTFAIEIGQHVSHTGNMELMDIFFGVVGFLTMFLVFALIRALVNLIVYERRRAREEDDDEEED